MTMNLNFCFFNQNSNDAYEGTIQKAIKNIHKSIENCADVYALAVSAYALHLADHESKKMVVNRLKELAKTKGKRFGFDSPQSDSNDKNILPFPKTNSIF